MARYQSGHVFEAYSAFHVRYYVTEIVDGQPKRVQRSKWLCKKDNHQPGDRNTPSWIGGFDYPLAVVLPLTFSRT